MNRILLALFAGVLALGGILATVAPASAATADSQRTASAQRGTPGCVTRAEYQRVRGGHTGRHVATIFGTWGRQVDRSESSYMDIRSNDGWETTYEVWVTDVDTYRDYRKCRSWRGWNRHVSINFDNYSRRSYGPGLRVYSKSA